MKIVIVDYKLGNLFSVQQAILHFGVTPIVSSNPADINDADGIILPGVGAFKDAMYNLVNFELDKAIQQFVASGKPIMGVCLGLQLLFTYSEEFGTCKGLNIIEGNVIRFNNFNNDGSSLKIPQIGWNTIKPPSNKLWLNTPLQDITPETYMYFVHSFHVMPKDKSITLTETTYGNTTYTSSIYSNNIFACQFHPEKSGEKGLSIYEKWLKNVTLFHNV